MRMATKSTGSNTAINLLPQRGEGGHTRDIDHGG